MTIRVGVLGAGGRMGLTVCEAVRGETDLILAAAVDPGHAGAALADVATQAQMTSLADSELIIGGDLGALTDAGVDVAIDFTHLDAARENLAFCGAKGIHAVVGTSGFTEADHAELRAQFTRSTCLLAANFAIGAVLMMRFAELAAPYFETAEIIELHHDQKIDAPSGTALATAERMAAASSEWAPDPTTSTLIEGARGARGPGDIPIHSVRMRGMTAHQEVVLGTMGQTLTVRHDSFDRYSFMPGVVLAAKAIPDTSGPLIVGLDQLLGI